MKILFIGNSHTFFNDMPRTVAELFRLCGENTAEAVMLTQGGMTLEWHSYQPQTRFNILYGGYDRIVLQDVAHDFVGRDKLLSDVGKIMEFVKQTDSKACLYMTWASLEKPLVQQEMIDAYTEAAEVCGTLLAPVGKVWEEVRYRIPQVPLFYTDGQHAGPYGSYLAACTIFCALTGRKSLSPDLSDGFYKNYDVSLCEKIHGAVAKILGN